MANCRVKAQTENAGKVLILKGKFSYEIENRYFNYFYLPRILEIH